MFGMKEQPPSKKCKHTASTVRILIAFGFAFIILAYCASHAMSKDTAFVALEVESSQRYPNIQNRVKMILEETDKQNYKNVYNELKKFYNENPKYRWFIIDGINDFYEIALDEFSADKQAFFDDLLKDKSDFSDEIQKKINETTYMYMIIMFAISLFTALVFGFIMVL